MDPSAYTRLMASRILISGSISPELYKTIVDDTHGYFTGDYGPRSEPLLICIASRGGDTETSHNIYTYLRAMPLPIITFAAGAADSAAALIFCAGDERIMTQHSSIYVHEPKFEMRHVGAHELREQVEKLCSMSERDINILREVTGQDEDIVREWHLHGKRFNAHEALEAGIATQVVTTSALRDPMWRILI